MKRSFYTFEFPISEGKALLYNTASGNVVVLGPEELNRYAGDGAEPSEELVAQGFFVPGDIDEIAHQSSEFKAGQQDRSILNLCIAPTYECNLRCPYCYEKDHTNTAQKMGEDVVERIVEFVQDVHARDGFSILDVQWYGGDPSLALDVVKEASGRLMDWAAKNEVLYTATMLSNCLTIGPDEAKLLADCNVREVMATIDGDSELHNMRRPAADGSDSYEAIVNAIATLQKEGINIIAVMNVDKVNAKIYRELRDELKQKLGVDLAPTKLNDYHDGFGCPGFCKPDFDLFTFPEYARWELNELREADIPAEQKLSMLKGRLSPFKTFCRGQAENYYCIDALGDVYKCDGEMGQPEYAVFSLFDEDLDVSELNTAVEDLTLDPQCGSCQLLPVCRGNCHWERECCGMPCHPLKYTLDDYLRLYGELYLDSQSAA